MPITISSPGGITVGSTVSGGTPTDVFFTDSSGNLGQSSSLTFDSGTLTFTSSTVKATSNLSANTWSTLSTDEMVIRHNSTGSGNPFTFVGLNQHTNTSGQNNEITINARYNQASGTASNTDLLVNRTQNAVGSGTQLLIDAQVGGLSKFSVSSTGLVSAASIAVSGNVGFYGTSPAAKPSAYTPTNVTSNRSYNADATTIDELSDVLGTLLVDLQSLGLIG